MHQGRMQGDTAVREEGMTDDRDRYIEVLERTVDELTDWMDERERDMGACIFMCTVGAVLSLVLSIVNLVM